MVVMARQTWSDERLDQFKERVDERFDDVDKRLDRMDADIRELRQAINQMHNTMSIGFIGLAGLIVSQAIFF
jgi:chaperonin cofactor prefoldin